MALCTRRVAAIDPVNGVWYINLDSDPTVGVGCANDDAGNALGIGTIGTVVSSGTISVGSGAVFQKTSAGATGWTNVSGQVLT